MSEQKMICEGNCLVCPLGRLFVKCVFPDSTRADVDALMSVPVNWITVKG